MEALTPERVTPRSGLPAYLATPSLRSASNHVMRSNIAFHATSQRVGRVSDFAMNEQARRNIPPNRVRYPADRSFASGCSPPRLTADAVTFGYGAVAYPGTDLHRADMAPSQAHSFRRKPESRLFLDAGCRSRV